MRLCCGGKTKLLQVLDFLGGRVDLLGSHRHIRLMDFDISHLLEQWEHQPGQVVARRFKTKDGREHHLLIGVLHPETECLQVLAGRLIFGSAVGT